MDNTIAAVFLCLSAVSVKGFLSAWLLSALLLQLSEPVSDALPFGRFLQSALFLNLPFPFGKTAVVLFYNGFGFSVGCHKRLHIGITVLFERIGQFIQPFGYFLLRLLYLLIKGFSLLASENALYFGKLCFQFRQHAVLQIADCPRLVLHLYHQIPHRAELCHINTERWLGRYIVFTDKVLQ